MNDFDDKINGTEKGAYDRKVNYENETDKVYNFTPYKNNQTPEPKIYIFKEPLQYQ